MADSIDRVFAHALQTVRKIPRSGSARPPAADRLKLYGLYKQSMEGDVEGVMERPSLLPPTEAGDLTREERAEVEKWDAWSACAGLTRSEAKCRYIDTLITTMHTYAYGTPEARELVNELQFVWDQVKSNAAFSRPSNNGSGEGVDIGRTPSGTPSGSGSASRRTGAGIDELLTSAAEGRTTEEGLRVLRPMSDQDEEEEQRRNSEAPPSYDGDGDEAERPRIRNGGSWQGRVDRALVQMTAEIAALREVVEARGRRVWGTRASRQGWISWAFGRVWALAKRVVVDALVAAVVFVVLRYRTGGVEGLVRLWVESKGQLRERLRMRIGERGGGGGAAPSGGS